MRITKEQIGASVGIILGIVFVYLFTSIVIHLLIAAIIAFAGSPLMKLLAKIKIKKWHLPQSLQAVTVMFVFVAVFVLFFNLLFPAIASQANQLQSLDPYQIEASLQEPLNELDASLKELNVLADDETVSDVASEKLYDFAATIDFNNIFGNILGLAGSFFMGAFSVAFFTFFFLKDGKLFTKIIMIFVPTKQMSKFSHVLEDVKRLLTRYSLGLMAELTSMMTLISIGGWIIGLENALLIGFLGGLMNIIPYLGPIIGAAIGVTLVMITGIDAPFYDVTMWNMIYILIVFAVANMVDNFVLQPIIYSKSVKAHPLEIFIVIIAAGSLAGPVGMILAIPIYTIIRITAREFLGSIDIVQKMTKGI